MKAWESPERWDEKEIFIFTTIVPEEVFKKEFRWRKDATALYEAENFLINTDNIIMGIEMIDYGLVGPLKYKTGIKIKYVKRTYFNVEAGNEHTKRGHGSIGTD